MASENRFREQVHGANERAAATLEQLERSRNWAPLGHFVLLFLFAAIGASLGVVGDWLSLPWLSLVGYIILALCVVLLFGAVAVGFVWDVFAWLKRTFGR